MAKIKLYEFTRSLEKRFPTIKNKDVVNLLNENGFKVKSALNNIEDDAIAFLFRHFNDPQVIERLNNDAAAAANASQSKSTSKEGGATSTDNKKTSTNTVEKSKTKKKAESTTKTTKKDSKNSASDVNEIEEKKEDKTKIEEKPVKVEEKEEKKPVKVEEKKVDNKEVKAEPKKSVDNAPKKDEPVKSAPAKDKQDFDKKNKNFNNRQNDRNQNRNGNSGNSDRRNDRNFDNRNSDNRNSGNSDRNNNRNFDRNKNPRNNNFDKRNQDDRDRRNNKDNRKFNNNDNNSYGQRNQAKKNDNKNDFVADFSTNKPDVSKRQKSKQDNKNNNNNKERGNKQAYNRKKDKNIDFNPLYPDGIRPRKPKKNKNQAGAFIKPEVVKKEEPEETIKNIKLPETLTIKEFADIMKIQPSKLIKDQFLKGNVVTLNHQISFEEAEEIALEYNCIAEPEEKVDVIAELLKEDDEDESLMVKRPPVVCVMGHVDHGKTSLLDAIRETHVTSREAGGITQHIGAYVTEINNQKITFLDTPGHEAFTAMRMRGAEATDIAVLVVAADDGVMPQTIEAINHAKAAGVEIIVAVNKIDKPSANIERVKQELVEYGLTAEDWGGETIFVPVSAHTKEGIETLLEMIILTSDICELKANPNRNARGVVIEAQLDKGRGPVATVLVQKGTLKIGDNIAVGSAYGKVRAMTNDLGQRVKDASPSMPVEIIGLHDVPEAGEIFMAVDSDKEAKNIAATYVKESREKLLSDTKSKLTLDGLFDQIKAGEVKELDLIVKADVQGSVEAVKQSLLKLSNEEVQVRVIHAGVGAINESDVDLASASNAIIIGFNVRPDNSAKETAEREKVDVRLYRVIYDAIEDIEAAMKGMLDPEFEEKVIAHLEVRQTFKASGIGIIAGSYVLDGKIERGSSVRITREGDLVFEGELSSLKRFKDDVKEVATGYECGLVIKDFNDIKEGDQIEAYKMVEIPRS
ncbi:MAG: translation initiation factor IF-2 [Lachnospiraceae bacterium]|nr:translation initiation factor IF-2 [Lachnospiraceae bacterium]